MSRYAIDGKELIEGKFYLWKVATQEKTGVDLHSVYFVTEKLHQAGTMVPDKFYEVVFTKPGAENPANGWYLVEKQVAPAPEDTVEEPKKKAEAIEGEIVDSDPNTLKIQVEDEMNVQAIFGSPPNEESTSNG